MGRTKLNVTPDWNESLGLFVILCGMPSTNKSCVVKLFEDQFFAMETFLGINPPPIQLLNEKESTKESEINQDNESLLSNEISTTIKNSENTSINKSRSFMLSII